MLQLSEEEAFKLCEEKYVGEMKVKSRLFCVEAAFFLSFSFLDGKHSYMTGADGEIQLCTRCHAGISARFRNHKD